VARATDRVLDALKHECVRATFFMLGATPVGVGPSRVCRGHTVRPPHYKIRCYRMPIERAGPNRPRHRRGGGGGLWRAGGPPRTPFFPLSGLSSSPALLDRSKRVASPCRRDLGPGDWNPMTRSTTIALLLQRLTKRAAASCCS